MLLRMGLVSRFRSSHTLPALSAGQPWPRPRCREIAAARPASLQCAELLAGLARSQLSQARMSRLDQRGADSGLNVSAQLGPAQCFSLRCRGATFGVLPCASQSGSSRTREVDEMLMIGHSMRPTQ